MDRYSGRSYCSKRLEFRFAVAVHGPVTVQPEFFQFPRRNLRLGISLSTNFSAFSSFRREWCELTYLSALIFLPFQEQEKIWQGLFVRCVVLFLSFFFFFPIPCIVFSKGEERRFGEGPLGENYNRIAAGGLGGLSPRSALQHPLRLRRRSGFRPVPKGGSGGSEEPSRAATRSAQQANKIFFFNFCVLFVSGPCCNHSVFTARMHKIAGFGSIFPKFSRGSMPPDPLEELGLRPITFWSA